MNIKKTIITCAIAALTISGFATEVKMADIFKGNSALTNGIWKASYEITNIPTRVASWDEYGRILKMIELNPETKIEWETFFSRPSNGFWIQSNKDFPIAFSNKCNVMSKTCPKFAALYRKYNTENVYQIMTLDELLSIYDECGAINTFKNNVKKHCLIALRRYLVNNGTGIAIRKIDGKEVNPLVAPMEELTVALNAPRMAGLNEWIAKYVDGKHVLDTSFLPSDKEVEKLIADIIDGKKNLSGSIALTLQKTLGVEKYNEFVDKINGPSGK